MRRFLCLGFLLLPVLSSAATVYHCKAYSGGTFWSSAHCGKHNALIDRIVSVPDGLPWDQQVNLADHSRAAGEALAAPPQAPVIVQQGQQVADKRSECQGLAAEVAGIEASARQPQSGQTQDWLTARKRKAQDRQFQLRC